MNMTRRILEGIHEVELEITPEFRKPEEPAGQLSYTVVDELLQSMGWINEGGKFVLSDHPKKTVSMTRWHRPDMPGTYIAALRHLIMGSPEPGIYEVFSWRANWGKQLIAPHLKDVEDTAEFLAASFGLAKLGAMGELVATEEPGSEEPDKTTFVVMVNHPDWQKPVKHLGPFDSASDAIAAAENWKSLVRGAEGGKSAEKKKLYSWEVRASDGGSVAKG